MTTWRACSCVANRRPWTQAVLSRPPRLSVGALSQQLPLRDIELLTPQALSVSWKSRLQYWVNSNHRRNTSKTGDSNGREEEKTESTSAREIALARAPARVASGS